MSQYRLVFSARADGQLAAIFDYVAERAGEDMATRLVDQVIERCLALDRFPNRGSSHEELGEGVRTVPFRRIATIGYVVVGRDVVVIGIAWRGQALDGALSIKQK